VVLTLDVEGLLFEVQIVHRTLHTAHCAWVVHQQQAEEAEEVQPRQSGQLAPASESPPTSHRLATLCSEVMAWSGLQN
jgi:hypothetical protein